MDLISRVGVIVLMELWCVLVLFWDFHSERLVCLGLGGGLGLAGAFITWELTPIDMDSKLKFYVMFVFLFQEIVSKAEA